MSVALTPVISSECHTDTNGKFERETKIKNSGHFQKKKNVKYQGRIHTIGSFFNKSVSAKSIK